MNKRENLKNIASREEIRELALNFEKAEQIRNGHKALHQAKFFH